MSRYKTLNGWLKAARKLADHQMDDLKGCESAEMQRMVGGLMAEIYNGLGEIDELERHKSPDESATSTSDKQTKSVRTTDHLK